MNIMRLGILCALVGWMATDVQAQTGTYGSPDPIPLGQRVPCTQGGPRDAYLPAPVAQTAYAAPADGPGPNLSPAAPVPGGMPQPPSESAAVSGMLSEPAPMAVGRPVPWGGGRLQCAARVP